METLLRSMVGGDKFSKGLWKGSGIALLSWLIHERRAIELCFTRAARPRGEPNLSERAIQGSNALMRVLKLPQKHYMR